MLKTDLSHDGIDTCNIHILIHPSFSMCFLMFISAEGHDKFSLNLEASSKSSELVFSLLGTVVAITPELNPSASAATGIVCKCVYV